MLMVGAFVGAFVCQRWSSGPQEKNEKEGAMHEKKGKNEKEGAMHVEKGKRQQDQEEKLLEEQEMGQRQRLLKGHHLTLQWHCLQDGG